MKLDYSPVERSPRSARRAFMVAAVCVIGLATLISRETNAKRHSLQPDSLLGDIAVAEAVAYQFDLRLGTELVPPTVFRTLRREELGEDWPWEEDMRPGSLQLFVEGARPSEESDLAQPDLANSEILCFLLGRYDNHADNLLVAPDGRLLLIDFEGAMDIQKVRYGEFPFLRRGGWHEGGLSAEESFPFDNPSKLVWVQVKVRSRHPAFTDFYPDSTMRNLERLGEAEIRALLKEPLGEAHLQGILERRRQLVESWKASG